MAKAKDTAKEAPKARTSKAKEKAAEKALLEGAMAETPEPLDAEARKMRLKALIKLGKERGYLTYAEINDLETTEIELGDYYEFRENFTAYFALGALLSLASIVLRRTRYEVIP